MYYEHSGTYSKCSGEFQGWPAGSTDCFSLKPTIFHYPWTDMQSHLVTSELLSLLNIP